MTRSAQAAIRAGALATVALAACKGSRQGDSSQDPPRPPPADAVSAPDANLETCRATAARVPTLPPAERAGALLEACRPCGDWAPLLAWNTRPADGGPSRAAIEQAMSACKAFCEPNAKQRFLGTLDDARGQPTRTPWRLLGEICKAGVSAVPDTRFMGAPYFALDRIARAIGDPAVLAAIEVPLPALSVTGVGLDLPSVAVAAAPAGPAALTVDAQQTLVGALPTATLSPDGLQVASDYPGTVVEPKLLALALDAALTVPRLAGNPVAVLAPYALDAGRIVDVLGAAGNHDLRLAVGAGGPAGWSVPGTLPISLIGRPTAGGVRLVLGGPAGGTGKANPASAANHASSAGTAGAANADAADATNAASAAIRAARATAPADLARGPVTITLEPGARVDGLASLLAALVALDVKAVALVKATAKPSAAKP